MKRLMIATDFSTRSDRALRRAALLARQLNAELVLTHVIDDDLPGPVMENRKSEADKLLSELCLTLRDVDGVPCTSRLLEGDPVEALGQAAQECSASVVILGPCRKRILRDTFIDTTAERAIRRSDVPVLMANALPTGFYSRVLIATDFSENALLAARKVHELGILSSTEIIALHAFDTPARDMMTRAIMSNDEIDQYAASSSADAGREMKAFLGQLGFPTARSVVELFQISPAETILEACRRFEVDLVVMGTQGAGGIARLVMGSVAGEVLRRTQVDVLAIPRASVIPD